MAEATSVSTDITPRDIEVNTNAKDQSNEEKERDLNIKDPAPNTSDERVNESLQIGHQENLEQESDKNNEDAKPNEQDETIDQSTTMDTLEQLEQLISNGSMEEFREKLQEEDTNTCDISGMCGEGLDEGTLIHQIVRMDQNGIEKDIRLLCDKRVDINQPDPRGRSPLHLASQLGKKKTVKALLENKADINATNPDGNTPLFIALMKGNDDCVALLMKSSIEENTTPFNVAHTNDKGQNLLHCACINAIANENNYQPFDIFHQVFDYLKTKREEQKMEELLVSEAVLDYIPEQTISPATIGICLADGSELHFLLNQLQISVLTGGESLFTCVVKMRESRQCESKSTVDDFVRKRCEQSLRALLYYRWTVAELKLMLKDPYISSNVRKTNSRKTLLHAACEKGWSSEIIKLLLEETRDVNQEDSESEYPLNYAIRSTGPEKIEILRQLLTHGALVNEKTKEALKNAVEEGEIEKIKYVRRFDPDMLENISRELLEDIFKENEIAEEDSCKILRSLYEVDPQNVCNFVREWRDDNGNNALQFAMKRDSKELLRFVIQYGGVDIMSQNNEKQTILDLITVKHESLIKFVRTVDYDATNLLIRGMEENLVNPTHLKYKEIESILRNRDFDINWRNPHDSKRTLLHMFCNLGNYPQIVELLLQKGADAKIKDEKSCTPARLLAQSKGPFKTEIVIVLAGHGSVFCGDGYDETKTIEENKEDAIVYLFYEGPVRMLEQMFRFKPGQTQKILDKLLKDKKNNCNGLVWYTYIRDLVRNGRVELLKFILEKRKKQTIKELEKMPDEGNGLHLACGKSSSLAMIRLMLDLGFDPNEKAAQSNNSAVKLLEDMKRECETAKETDETKRRKAMAIEGIDLFKSRKAKKTQIAQRGDVVTAKEEIVAILKKNLDDTKEDFKGITKMLDKLTDMASIGIVTAASPPMLDVHFHEMATKITGHPIKGDQRKNLMDFLLSDGCGKYLQKYFKDELEKMTANDDEKLYNALVIWKV